MKYLISLIFLFFSIQSFAYIGDGGASGGGGASGSWGGDKCEPQKKWSAHHNMNELFDSPQSACSSLSTRYPYMSGFSYKSGACYGFYADGRESSLTFPVEKDNPNFNPSCQCKENEELVNGKCVPICKSDETLINGQCKPKTCPLGQILVGGQCKTQECSAGQTMVNGQCKLDPNKPDNPDSDGDGKPDLPPFCEWASVMCEWHKEWQQWSNDYNANEEKANLDREELKRIGLDSKEYLNEINQNSKEQLQQLKDHQIKLDEIKNQDKQFYDELRLWLKNFNPNDGNPSEQNPSIQFPKFCDWSVQMCNWYLDWKDWRSDYNAYNEVVKQKFDEHKQKLEDLEKLQQEQNAQDKKHYDEATSFYEDARDFFEWMKQAKDEETPPDPEQPTDPEPPTPEPDSEQRVNWQASCPTSNTTQSITIGDQTTTISGFDYSEACNMASSMRPLVLLAGALISLLIIAGGRP